MKGKACDRRPHDKCTSNYYIFKCCVKEDRQNGPGGYHPQWIDVKLADILNVYVQASVTKKVWTILGLEFGKDASKTSVITRALYG